MKKPNFNEQIKSLTKTTNEHFARMDKIVSKKCGDNRTIICVYDRDINFCEYLVSVIRRAKYRVVSCYKKDKLKEMLNMDDIGFYIADPEQTPIGRTLNGNYLAIHHPIDETLIINQIQEKFGPPIDTRERDRS